jgi:hypothetical protein
MDVVNTVINCVLLVLTAAVVVYAARTIGESKKTTTAAQNTVTELKNLLAASKDAADAARTSAQETVTALGDLLAAVRDTATASEAASRAARETVEVAHAARAADERYRQLEQLREIGRAVQRILLDALQAPDSDQSFSINSPDAYLRRPRWRSADQNALRVLLVGVEPPLPKCMALTGESQPGPVIRAAQAAEAELAQVFHHLGVSYLPSRCYRRIYLAADR